MFEVFTTCFNTLSEADATAELLMHDDMVWHRPLSKQSLSIVYIVSVMSV